MSVAEANRTFPWNRGGGGGVRVHVVHGDPLQGEYRPVVPVDELTAFAPDDLYHPGLAQRLAVDDHRGVPEFGEPSPSPTLGPRHTRRDFRTRTPAHPLQSSSVHGGSDTSAPTATTFQTGATTLRSRLRVQARSDRSLSRGPCAHFARAYPSAALGRHGASRGFPAVNIHRAG